MKLGDEMADTVTNLANINVYKSLSDYNADTHTDTTTIDLVQVDLDATYAAKTEAIKAISFSGRTVTLTKTDNTTSTVANTYALYSEVWDSNGHLVSPAGWVFYITNDAYNA